jgi:hypothetical protein
MVNGIFWMLYKILCHVSSTFLMIGCSTKKLISVLEALFVCLGSIVQCVEKTLFRCIGSTMVL